MPAVLLSAMLALCTAVVAQGPSATTAPVPAIASDLEATSVPAAMRIAVAAEPKAEPHPGDASAANAPAPLSESPLSRGFSVAEAGLLLLVGTCMVWVGFAKRRNTPPRRVVR